MNTALPTLTALPRVAEEIEHFLTALGSAGFIGDIDASYGGRLIAATDNSIYQQLPQAVVYPKSSNDLQCLLRVANRPAHQHISFSPRGGGTGTNGQSLTPGVVIDLSRYLTNILELNLAEGWVRVEAGLVKDALNDFLAPHGYFFAPDTSTSNRATIGGMVCTDASGQGSLVYGKTSNHVLALRAFLANGEELNTTPISRAEAEQQATLPTTLGAIYRQVLASCVNQRAAIEAKFPPLNRFLTGYDLQHTWDTTTDTIDLARLITGAEGSLAFVTEAKLNITPIPNYKVLVNVKYQNFQAALRHAPSLVQARATSVETVDSKVFDLARNDIIWNEVKDLLTDVEGFTMDGINMVEFTAVNQAEINDKVQRLCATLDALDPSASGVIGYQVCADLPSIQRIYAMRKKAVGLLGATKGRKKPVAFVEDTAVPPEHLADFIDEFRALLDAEDLQYGMFGHVDAGVLHVRPALDLIEPEDEAVVRRVSDQVMQLTAKYGGLMWGEHGKGYRSEYGPEFFGEALFLELRRLKAVFDPHNRLNPGKICTPIDSEAELVSVDARKRGWYDRQIPLDVRETWQSAMDCNGNGLCFNYDVKTPMCPSYRGSNDRRFSPKGRATLLREWLRLTHTDGNELGQVKKRFWLQRVLNSRKITADFNHEVREAMDTCLSCKACTTQCPVSVDIPTHKSRFYNYYFSQYARPLKDYLVRDAEQLLPRLARFPRLANALMNNHLSRLAQEKLAGYTDTPNFAVPSLQQRLNQRRNFLNWDDFTKVAAAPYFTATDYVVVVQDVFTSCYEPELLEAFLKVAEHCGKTPVVMPFMPNGKGLHVKGFLNEFEQQAQKTAAALNELHTKGIPLVGLDAATTLCFRDEYNQALGQQRGDFQVLLAHEWLIKFMPKNLKVTPTTTAYNLLSHCTEQTALPLAKSSWAAIFNVLGLSLATPATGCCGMAGSFGHEVEQKDLSEKIFALNWQQELQKEGVQPLATGFSCRCQSERFAQQSSSTQPMKPVHPLIALAELL